MEQSKRPQLFVISGPNGAGKSTFTDSIVPKDSIIINPDIIASKLKTAQADLQIGLLKNKAIQSKQNISIETNFLFKDEIRDFQDFKDNGYQINLIFIALKDLKESQIRVDMRTKKGGHYVDAYTRELNYNIGKENCIENANQFDKVLVIANSLEYRSKLLLSANGETLFKNDEAPLWAKDLIQQFEQGIKNDLNISSGYKR